MRVTLIHNPGAGGGQPDEKTLIKMVRDAGHEVLYQSSADRDWVNSLEAPADLVAVAGGDGTVGRIAKMMIGRGIPIAPLPLGTANNISRTLGATEVSLEQLIASWDEGRRLKLYAGVATGPWGRTRFIEGVGLGLFAWMMPRATASEGMAALENSEDKLVYALQMLKDRLKGCEPIRVTASLDGRDISGEYLMLEALNISYVGPNLYLAPHGKPTDGCLDVALVSVEERNELFTCLGGWQRGTLCRPSLPTHRGRHLRIEWTGFPLHIDDDLWPKEGEKAASAPSSIEVRITNEMMEFIEPGSSGTG